MTRYTPSADRAELGLGHRLYPLLNRPVVDTKTGRHGILRAIAPSVMVVGRAGPQLPSRNISQVPDVAWVIPHGGGREWTTDVDAIVEDHENG